MKVNGLIDNPKWKKILVCTCEGKIDLCNFCKYTKAEKSIPSKDFKIQQSIFDKNGKIIKTVSKTIKEVTIVRGSHEDVIAWSW